MSIQSTADHVRSEVATLLAVCQQMIELAESKLGAAGCADDSALIRELREAGDMVRLARLRAEENR